MKIDLTNIFNDFYTSISAMIPKIIMGLMVLILFIILGKLFYSIVGKRIQRKWSDSLVSRFIAEASKWAFYTVGIVIALNFVGFGGIASSLIAGAGISAIVIGFAFKDIGENFLAGIILALKRPFEVGDIIEIDGYKGNVKGLDLRTTHLRNVDGRDIYIPNSSIIKNALINYTKDGFLRISFNVGIAPESKINQARDLIIDYLNSNNEILSDPVPNVLVHELGEFTVDLQVLFWVDILKNKNLPDSYLGHTIRSKVITKVKQILDDHAIEMPSQVLEHKMYRDKEIKIAKQQ
ncbi:MAG: mechanosensitive ion channel family protein [Flavobacteriaceae bacterium]|nr:mechanosensitive ion channel family protein [Flavobacteriaceae bacterium]